MRRRSSSGGAAEARRVARVPAEAFAIDSGLLDTRALGCRRSASDEEFFTSSSWWYLHLPPTMLHHSLVMTHWRRHPSRDK